VTWWALFVATLRYYAKDHVLVIIGIALAGAVLTGSLIIGASVRGTLHNTALARIGQAETAIVGQGRFLRSSLDGRLATALGDGAIVAPILQLRGLSALGDYRANVISVCGVTEQFWALAPQTTTIKFSGREVAINTTLAAQLRAKVGDSVVIRVEKPGFLPRDAPLSSTNDTTVAMRLTVNAILEDNNFGRFNLAAVQTPTPTAFVDLAFLQEATDMERIANVLLVRGGDQSRVEQALRDEWIPDDALIEVRSLGVSDSPHSEIQQSEIRAQRIFLDEPLVTALAKNPAAAQIVTYFVNELRVGERTTPYSLMAGGAWELLPAAGAPIPANLLDEEIAINSWLADDLQAKIGDTVRVRYYALGPAGGLVENEASFTIKAIIPLTGLAADAQLMPRFPGISEQEDCKNWHPGVPVHLERIRDKDEKYWDDYRGTPKAFINLATGKRLFGNRYGEITALRLADSPARVTAMIKAGVTPTDLGIHTLGIRALALQASAAAMDFSGLFLGLGFFTMVAALTLAGMLIMLGVERRRRDMGVLLALGWTARGVGQLIKAECLAVAAIGSGLGVLAGITYAQVVLLALSTTWGAALGSVDANSAVSLHLFITPLALVMGFIFTYAVAAVVLWWRVRLLHREPVARLLRGQGTEFTPVRSTTPWSKWVALVTGLAALVLIIVPHNPPTAVGLFFACGALALISGISGCSYFFASRMAHGLGQISQVALALANATRARSRTMAVITVLAAACFIIVAVGANRRDPLAGAEKRSAGTGGFQVVMTTAVPLADNLNNTSDRERLGMNNLDGVHFHPLRVGHGDDASCLNLNRSASPRLYGVDPAIFADRFSFSQTIHPGGWSLLAHDFGDAIPAIGDENTTRWSLGLTVGERLKYTDERGNTFDIVLVGTVAHSLLQGGLFISETHFTARFPSQGGHSMWLIDAPATQSSAVIKELSRALADYGATCDTAVNRLAMYLAVERTYLDIFLTLGGLALLLGSIGVGVVVVRNMQERRAELAALSALGFTRRALRRLLVIEHTLLLLLGLCCGAGAGLLAVFPALTSLGTPVPWMDLVVALAVIALSGFLVLLLATRQIVCGNISDALRKE
jgi:putative ABC transport system permease protein